MIEHLDEHQHAFVKDNKVIWVGVFNGHDESFLDTIRIEFNADQVVCCCNLGFFPSKGWDYIDNTFVNPNLIVEESVLDYPADTP